MSRAAATAVSAPPEPASLRWAREYLPDYFSDAPAPFHVELMRDIEDPAHRLIARIAPRGHAKSTCASLAYPLWCVCEQKRRNIVIVTHELSLARQFLRDIRIELESNPHILDSYGDLCAGGDGPPECCESPAREESARRDEPRAKGAPAKRNRKKAAGSAARPRPTRPRRSQDILTTTTGVTVQAKSCGGSLRGTRVGSQRPDLIICDDIEKDDRVASPDGRRKLEYWLRRVVMPALAPGGQLLVLGSLIHYDSLLANLRDPQRFPHWDYRVYRALEGELGADGQYYLRALWPARWPVARLDEERQRVGTLAFEQEYMANPIDESIRVFPPERLKRYDPAELESRREMLQTIMTVDPATGAEHGDFFAIWVGCVDRGTGIIYTLQLTLERIGIVEQVQRVVAAFEKWHPLKIGVETTAYQVALKDVLDDYSRQHGKYMPIFSLRPVGAKRARIEATAPFYENGTFRLPQVLDPEAESQFLQFPKSAHDDAPDVCMMGIDLARTLQPPGGIRTRPRGAAIPRKGGL